ncbi:ATP-dependent DNA ligase [Streptomyces lavendulocolor]|uniref:ATP-dependent DNA ligase n=1 Tax=Streptomyces lavendulocolor TaxID=67316 RepID=UPI0031D6E024
MNLPLEGLAPVSAAAAFADARCLALIEKWGHARPDGRPDVGRVERPVSVALARSVATLPRGRSWWYEPKSDGHRAVLFRDADTVQLQSRAGRDVTGVWMDLAVAGMALLPGTVLEGEVVIWREGRVDFHAVQSRAASSPTRARALAVELPASYPVWDILQHPVHGDVRPLPYVERRALLLDLLADIPPPIQPVPATDDYDTALLWVEHLREQGLEGVVAKPGRSAYRGGSRIWQKVRHSGTVDAAVVGYTGASARPRALAVRLPDGRMALSQRLTAPLSAAAAVHLIPAGPGPRSRTGAGDTFTTTTADFEVEVLSGTTRHAVVTVTRVR